MKKLIAEGAEAKIYLNNNKIIKERIKKNYRLPEIDLELRKSRTSAEERIIKRAIREGINVPKILKVNKENYSLEIEFIDGQKIRNYIDETSDLNVFKKIGEQINKLHVASIIHGDLTTSNMILKENKVYIIDFGLSSYSEKVEDKAVDLHVLKECLTSKHFQIAEKAWKEFLKSYKQKEILIRLEKVEKRGKYKQ